MNLSYLFAAYSIVWVGLLVYVITLARRNHSLEREVEELRELLKRRPH